MLGEEERSSSVGSFSEASVPRRMLIVAAGGLVNIFFGIIVYFVLVSSSGNYISTKIDTIIPNYAAEQAGIEVGDKLLKINNKKVRLRSDIDKEIQNSNGNEIKLIIERNNEEKEIILIPTQEQTKSIGIYLGVEDENLTTEIKGIFPNSTAQEVGIKEGDIIVSIDKIACENDPYKTVELINNSKNEKIRNRSKKKWKNKNI
ncbi:MAG: PDZ domain-containing protein [Clostridia bacterium]|nr:PDZ domain-containing protein [Clostridia bacterium]